MATEFHRGQVLSKALKSNSRYGITDYEKSFMIQENDLRIKICFSFKKSLPKLHSLWTP